VLGAATIHVRSGPGFDDVPTTAMEMETDRLALRPWTPADAQWLYELHRERAQARGGNAPRREATERLVNGMMARAAASGISLLPVVRKTDGLAIGCCGLIEGRA
jgi:RimJ/RimL family protein N-acetyltransferase